MQDVNRLKIVLVEQKKTSKWLSEALGGKSIHCFKMVYEFITARHRNPRENLETTRYWS